MGAIDEDEFLNFLNRVGRHALANEQNPRGVDIQAFIRAVKSARFSAAQLETWRGRIAATFDAQREVLFGTLHGIYCTGQRPRHLSGFRRDHGAESPVRLVDRHQDYRAKGDEARHKASQQSFERLGLVSLLGESEVHSLITSAARNLLSVHYGYDNFYNERP